MYDYYYYKIQEKFGLIGREVKTHYQTHPSHQGNFIYDFQVAPEMQNCGLVNNFRTPSFVLLGCKVCSVFFLKKKGN